MASELASYVSDALRKGYSESYLRQSLLRQGWQENDINQAFASARAELQPVQPSQSAASGYLPKRMVLRRIGVLSAAKISMVMFGIGGIIMGVFIAVMFSIAGPPVFSSDILLAGNYSSLDVLGVSSMFAGLGILMTAVMPIVMAMMGFVSGALFALVYNFVAGLAGGYKVEFED